MLCSTALAARRLLGRIVAAGHAARHHSGEAENVGIVAIEVRSVLIRLCRAR
jgi:hypothetical protein